MSSEYRVRYKKGETEIEVQSADQEYVSMMIDKLLVMTPKHHEPALPPATSGSRARRAPKKTRDEASVGADSETNVDAATVANRVNEADNHAVIEKHILNKASRLAKVLLAFHFAHECGYEQLTSGDVEKITDELGVKVEQSSASHCISDNRKLFSAGAARRKGAKVPYKLNRQGSHAYKQVLETGKM